jgi:hypothetical protein
MSLTIPEVGRVSVHTSETWDCSTRPRYAIRERGNHYFSPFVAWGRSHDSSRDAPSDLFMICEDDSTGQATSQVWHGVVGNGPHP